MSSHLVELVQNQDTRKKVVHAGRSGQTLCGWRFFIGKDWITACRGPRPESDALVLVTCRTCRSVIQRNSKLEAKPG